MPKQPDLDLDPKVLFLTNAAVDLVLISGEGRPTRLSR